MNAAFIILIILAVLGLFTLMTIYGSKWFDRF